MVNEATRRTVANALITAGGIIESATVTLYPLSEIKTAEDALVTKFRSVDGNNRKHIWKENLDSGLLEYDHMCSSLLLHSVDGKTLSLEEEEIIAAGKNWEHDDAAAHASDSERIVRFRAFLMREPCKSWLDQRGGLTKIYNYVSDKEIGSMWSKDNIERIWFAYKALSSNPEVGQVHEHSLRSGKFRA